MRHLDDMQKLTRFAFLAIVAFMIVSVTAWALLAHRGQPTTQPAASATNEANGGFLMAGNPAPDFTLVDQFGHSVTLSSLHGREVVLAFIDSRCKDVCPLTAQNMYDARARLKASEASQVELVAVNANPTATSVLESVYHLYHVYVQVDSSGQVVHDSVTFIIDAQGRERPSFWTLNSHSQSDLGDEISGLEAGMQQWLPKV